MAAKRKDVMANIEAQLSSTAYNMGRYNANVKFLKEKVKFFEKKRAAGEDLGFMGPRLERAQKTLQKVQALKSGVAPPAEVANSAAASAAAIGGPAKSKGKTARKPSNSGAAASSPAKGKTIRRVAFKNSYLSNSRMVRGHNGHPLEKRVILGNNGKPLRIKGFTPIKEPVVKASKSLRNTSASKASKPAASKPAASKSLANALPVLAMTNLYNPFTGRKFEESDDAITEVNKAVIILKKAKSDAMVAEATRKFKQKRANAAAAKALASKAVTARNSPRRNSPAKNNSTLGSMMPSLALPSLLGSSGSSSGSSSNSSVPTPLSSGSSSSNSNSSGSR